MQHLLLCRNLKPFDILITVIRNPCCSQRLQHPKYSSNSSREYVHSKGKELKRVDKIRKSPHSQSVVTKSVPESVSYFPISRKMKRLKCYLDAVLAHRVNPRKFLKPQSITSTLVGDLENQFIPKGYVDTSLGSWVDDYFQSTFPQGMSSQQMKYYMENPELWHIRKSLLKLISSHSSVDEIWHAYSQFPYPRAQFIERQLIRKLIIRILRMPKGQTKLSRFTSIIGDLQVSLIPIRLSEWTGLISVLATSFDPVEKPKLDTALRLWKQMESTGMKADIALFNTLLSIAVKVKKWHIADNILNEIKVRGLEYDRYTWSSCFMLMASQKNHAALVSAFCRFQKVQVVDTVILNAVIYGFLSCRDPGTAHRFYKQMFRTSTTDPLRPQTAKDKRMLMASKSYHPYTSPIYQKYGRFESVAPDIATYSILLHYHCIYTGNFQFVASLLQDMEVLGIVPNESIFSPLFRGFALRGSPAHASRPSEWTGIRLERCFDTLISPKYKKKVRLNKMLVIWIIRSFKKLKLDNIERVWKPLDAMWEAQGVDLTTRRPAALVTLLNRLGISV